MIKAVVDITIIIEANLANVHDHFHAMINPATARKQKHPQIFSGIIESLMIKLRNVQHHAIGINHKVRETKLA